MSSTNKTTNLNLNQWLATDPVMREDFNADNTKIDTAVAAVNAAVALRQPVAAGSYVGTGVTPRQDHPNTLTFPFHPHFVLILSLSPESYTGMQTLLLPGTDGRGFVLPRGSSDSYVTWSGNTVNWYSPTNNTYQANDRDVTYTWIAA